MNQFFVNLGKNELYAKLLKEPFTYVTGAVILAVLQIAHIAFFSKGWGVTSTLADWGAMIYHFFGGDVSHWAYFSTDNEKKVLAEGFLGNGGSVRNLGIIFGAFISTLYCSQFKIKKIKTIRQIFAAIFGGLLMGYGARLALGCNIGALFTGVITFSLSGWVFAIFLLIGTFIGTKLLKSYFME